MKSTPNHMRIHTDPGFAASLFAAVIVVGTAVPAGAGAFLQTDLVTDDNVNLTSLGFPAATTEDPNLVNPWGVSFSASSPFWVSDNGTGVTTLYNGAGIPTAASKPAGRHDRAVELSAAKLCKLGSDRPSVQYRRGE